MSPYENQLAHEDFRRVGLIAIVPTENQTAVAEFLSSPPADLTARLAAVGIQQLDLFASAVDSRAYLFAFLHFAGTDFEAVPGIVAADPWLAQISPLLEPHPRADASVSPWLRMELINVCGPTLPAPSNDLPVTRTGFLSGLLPDRELPYRTLHQTNWPGIVDQMARSHIRYWVTFLIEFGADLRLFTYCEYTGTDRAADDALMANDPVTQRWWAHTEPCLISLDGSGRTWVPMDTSLRLVRRASSPDCQGLTTGKDGA